MVPMRVGAATGFGEAIGKGRVGRQAASIGGTVRYHGENVAQAGSKWQVSVVIVKGIPDHGKAAGAGCALIKNVGLKRTGG